MSSFKLNFAVLFFFNVFKPDPQNLKPNPEKRNYLGWRVHKDAIPSLSAGSAVLDV